MTSVSSSRATAAAAPDSSALRHSTHQLCNQYALSLTLSLFITLPTKIIAVYCLLCNNIVGHLSPSISFILVQWSRSAIRCHPPSTFYLLPTAVAAAAVAANGPFRGRGDKASVCVVFFAFLPLASSMIANSGCANYCNGPGVSGNTQTRTHTHRFLCLPTHNSQCLCVCFTCHMASFVYLHQHQVGAVLCTLWYTTTFVAAVDVGLIIFNARPSL